MKTLQKFIFKSYLPPFALTFVISVFILFMQFLWKWIDELVGKGLEWTIIVELFSFAALQMIPLALPMAVLLSSLMAFGNMAEHYELAALKSAGISLVRIMRPLILFTVFITAGAFLFSNYVLPYINLKAMSTLYDIHQQKPALNIKEGVFNSLVDGYSIRIDKIEEDGQVLKGIMIYDHSAQAGNVLLTVAEYGKMSTTTDNSFLVMELKNGETYQEMWSAENASVTKPFVRIKFKEQIARIDLSGLKMVRTNAELFKENDKMLTGGQLLSYIDTMKQSVRDDKSRFYVALSSAYLPRTKLYWKSLDTVKAKTKTGDFLQELSAAEKSKAYELAMNNARNCKANVDSKLNEIDAEEKSIIRFKIEYWRKWSLSFACLIMFFIGAPLGALIRKGGLGLPVVISIICFLLFWVMSIVGEKLAKEGTIPAEFGMWFGCLTFLPLGIWLTKKATADSGMFDSGGIFNRIKNLFRRKNKNAGSDQDNSGDSSTLTEGPLERIENIPE
ncbi:MAG: LptF/LptG family permease [Bacteroidota bacterium]|nr:LptF/LptG family permease [Bacteroidota bacterium]